jgi:DNA-binding protein HU-beta
MSDRVDKNDLVKQVAQQTGHEEAAVAAIIEATLEAMVDAFKQGQSVSLRNFGTFYVRPERSSTVFRFNPSQRLRKLLGWSSTYKGEV